MLLFRTVALRSIQYALFIFCIGIIACQCLGILYPRLDDRFYLASKIFPELHMHVHASPFLIFGIYAVVMILIIACARVKFKNMLSPRNRLLMLTGIAVLLRICSLSFIRNLPVSDFQIYHELGLALKNGLGFSYAGFVGLQEDLCIYLNRQLLQYQVIPTAFRPPGWPMLLAMIYAVLPATLYLIGAQIFNLLLSVLSGICLYLLLKKLDESIAFWSALLWLIYPTTVLSVNLLGTEVPFSSLLIFTAFFLNKALADRHKINPYLLLLAALSGGYCFLIRCNIMILLSALAAIIICGKNIKRTAIAATIFIIGFYIPLAGFGLRNYITFKKFYTGSTNVGITLYQRSEKRNPMLHQAKYMKMKTIMEKSTDQFLLNETGKKLFKAHITTALRRDPLRFVITMVPRYFYPSWIHDSSILMWCAKSDFLLTTRPNAKKPISLQQYLIGHVITTFFYIVYTSLALIGSVCMVKLYRFRMLRNPAFMMFLTYFIFNNAVFCLVKGAPRYHFTLMLIVSILAGVGVVSINRLSRDRRCPDNSPSCDVKSV